MPTTVSRLGSVQGGARAELGDLSGRVLDGYTNIPIGTNCLQVASRTVWRQYWRQLPWAEDMPRYLWRFQRVGWLMFGTALAAAAQFLLRSI